MTRVARGLPNAVDWPGALASLRVPLPWVLTWLSCRQRARSRAGGAEQQLVAANALASSPGWTKSARAVPVAILRVLMDYEVVK